MTQQDNCVDGTCRGCVAPLADGGIDLYCLNKSCNQDMVDAAMMYRKMQVSRAAMIADKVVPKYRDGVKSYSCGSWIGKMWGAAYEAALLAARSDQ